MAFKLSFSVAVLLLVCSSAVCDVPVEGVLQMECHENYFLVAVDLAVTGQDPHFEAVDGTGVHPLTDRYAAECGYSINILPFLGVVEVRASYLSCHTEKKENAYVFAFNLATKLGGEAKTSQLNKTCAHPTWSPREVSCEVNYMEVSVQYEPACTSKLSDDWSALRPVYSSSPVDWKVAFQNPNEPPSLMNLTEARERGYLFELKNERIVFRTPYGQLDSYSAEVLWEVNGVQVEVVHASVFSRRGWFVLIVDLVASCSMHQGMFSDGFMMWETPESWYPSFGIAKISFGVNGDLVEQDTAKQRGFTLERRNATVKIGIPFNAEGGFRKSFISGGIFEFHVFHIYFKLVSVNEYQQETVVRSQRTLVSPLLPLSLNAEDRTVPKEGVFKVFLGNVPEDVDVTSIQLNGQNFDLPMSNESTITIAAEVQRNDTYGYTLKVPFKHVVVIKEFSTDHTAMLHRLSINYTLTVLGSDSHHYNTSVTALTDVSPPVLGTNCSKAGITFILNHRPYDYLWKLTIGTDLLTMDLAAERGYILTNSTQTLVVFIPLFTPGYKYKEVSLKGFFGTFEITVRDLDTSQVQAVSVKTCRFDSKEFIMCSTDGTMTVATELSSDIPNGEMPEKFHLNDRRCGPQEVSGTRVLFTFPVNSCESSIKLRQNVTYKNTIFYTLKTDNSTMKDDHKGVTVECSYSLRGLSSVFSVYRFESETEGLGKIVHSVQPTQVPTTTQAPPPLQTTAVPQKTRFFLPAYNQAPYYLQMAQIYSKGHGFKKGTQRYMQVKQCRRF